MSYEEKLELLAETLDCDVEEITAETELETLENWDSMTKLSLIVLMDDEFGKTLTSDVIKTFSTIGDIMNYMG